MSHALCHRAATLSCDLRHKVTCSVSADILATLGTPIRPFDTLIAAHALSLDAALVTRNLREFRRVLGLRAGNWFGP